MKHYLLLCFLLTAPLKAQENDEDVEAQLLNRPVDEQGYERSLVTGRRKLRQHHLFRGPEERRRDEDYEGKPARKRKRAYKEKYVKEEIPSEGAGRRRTRVVKRTKEVGPEGTRVVESRKTSTNWRDTLPVAPRE